MRTRVLVDELHCSSCRTTRVRSSRDPPSRVSLSCHSDYESYSCLFSFFQIIFHVSLVYEYVMCIPINLVIIMCFVLAYLFVFSPCTSYLLNSLVKSLLIPHFKPTPPSRFLIFVLDHVIKVHATPYEWNVVHFRIPSICGHRFQTIRCHRLPNPFFSHLSKKKLPIVFFF